MHVFKAGARQSSTLTDLSGSFDPSRVRRVLIYRLGSLGDTMVVLPALHLIARVFPHADRRMLSNEPVHGKAPAASAILNNSGLITGYMSYPVGTRNPLTLARIALSVRLYRPDLLVYLTKPRGEKVLRRDQLFFGKACGIPSMIGLPFGSLGQNLLPKLPGGLWESEAERLVRSLAPLGTVDVKDLRNWSLGLNSEEEAAAEQALAPLARRPLLACGPGTKMQAKDWGTASWQRLLDRLALQHPEHGLILLGARDDYAVSAEVSSAWSGRVLNLCGALPPRVTAAAIARAELFLGPDSGPMHFAAAVGVPCAIAFASRTEPGVWYPAGQGHEIVYHRLSCSNCDLEVCLANAKRCLATISPEEMFVAAERAWTAGQARKHPAEAVSFH